MNIEQAKEVLDYMQYKSGIDEAEFYALATAIKSLDMWDKVKEQILEEKEHAYADFDDYKMLYLNAESDELPFDDFRFGMERTIDIISKHLKEIEE